MKNNWVAIKKINGNISKIIAGEFKRDKNKGMYMSISTSLKKSNSLSKFKTKTRLIIIANTYKSDLKKLYVKNLIYTFILFCLNI